jgi:ubiquinone/menaquinone biosynthesis C-methylase UbiE
VTVNYKRRRMPQMEGAIARWYARNRGTGSQRERYRQQAVELTAGLADGAAVLEVAPGPGYLAVDIARLGRFTVTGLDISHTFVEIATSNARDAGVSVDFQPGDVARMPFPAESFDLVVCQAAFKNFEEPVRALNEMHRVLRPGGTAVIHDLSRHATGAAIDAEVRRMRLNGPNAFLTRLILTMLRLRAFAPERFAALAGESAFGTAEISTEGIGLEVRLRR